MQESFVGLAVGGALACLAVVVGGFVAVRSCRTDPSNAGLPLGADTAAARAGAEGMSARGTSELRALGCTNAVVIDMQRLLESSAKGAGRVRPDEPRYMVTCDVPSAAVAPPCDSLATAYFGAIGGSADDNVCVRVNTSGAAKPACSRLYAPNGVDLGPFPRTP
jgi:hypothetical protein